MQKLLGDKKAIEAEGTTVREVIADVDRRFPGFKEKVVEDGKLLRFVGVT